METYNAYLNGVKVASGLETPTYTFTELSPSTEYTIQFSAEFEGLESELSEPLVQTTSAKVVVPTGVTITPKTSTFNVGAKGDFSATVAPVGATDKTIKYTVDKPTILEVDVNGKYTAKAAGTAKVTVTTNSGAKTDVATITVVVPVTGVKVTPVTSTKEVGGTQKVTITVEPANATNKEFTVANSKPAVASFAGDTFTALTAGQTVLTVTTKDGNRKGTATLDVTEPVVP